MYCLTLWQYLLYTYPKHEQVYEMLCGCSENTLGKVLRSSRMGIWLNIKCSESSRASVPITEAGSIFSFLVLWIAFCIQLSDQLEVLKSFSWKCILKLRSSMSSLKIISSCDLGILDRIRQRSLDLFSLVVACLFFHNIYRNFDILSDYCFSLVLQVSWQSKQYFIQDGSKNPKIYVSISFGNW